MIPYANLFKRKSLRALLRTKWRTLKLGDLSKLIDEIRGTSVVQHLTTKQWAQLDRMRARAAQLAATERSLKND